MTAADDTARLCAVMVTFNRLEQLRTSLPRLLAEVPGTVLLVDNASTDGTADWLAGFHHPRLRPLRLPENLGGAGGFEQGMQALAASEDPDWILLLDDDAWPQPGLAAAFAETVPALPADTGAVAGAVFLPGGAISEMNRPGWNPFWYPAKIWSTLTSGSRAGFKLPDACYTPDAGLVEVDNASFVGYLVSRRARQRVGLPEGGLFIYGDDVLYSLRLRRAGMKLVFAPGLRFTHDCTSLDGDFVYRPLWKVYYTCRNGVAIARQAAGPVVFPLALVWYLMLWWRRGQRCQPAERPVYRRMMWQGIRDGLRSRRGRKPEVHDMVAAVEIR